MRHHVVIVFTTAEVFVVTRLAGALPVAVRMGSVNTEVATPHLRLGVLIGQCWCGCIRDRVHLLSFQ